MKTEPIEFEVNDLTLRGNFYRAAEPGKLAVLFLHGWTGLPHDDTAAKMAENGFTSMTFSLSGHNNSEGRIEDQTRQKTFNEILAAYDFFMKKLPTVSKIGAAGSSYGSYMAAILSTTQSLEFISLRVPANYPDQGFNIGNRGHEDDFVSKWRQKPVAISDNRALKAVNEFRGPVQIIEAGQDEMIPHQVIQNYVDAIGDKSKLDYHLMKDWSHGLGGNLEHTRQYQEILLDWLRNL